MRFWTLLLMWAAFLAACYGFWQWCESARVREHQRAAWEYEQQIAATETALARPVELGDRWLALHELPDLVERATGLVVVIDAQGLEEEGVRAETPLARLRGRFSARAALTLLLQPLNLSFDVEKGRIVITNINRSSDQNELVTVVYPLPQSDFSAPAVNHEAWLDLVATIVRPESWDDVGGQGHCEAVPGGLVIVQTRSAQREVRQLLETLGRLRSPPESFASVPIAPFLAPEVEKRIIAALAEPTKVDAAETPLDQVAEKLAERHGIPIVINSTKLHEAGVTTEVPITLSLSGPSLAAALRRMLDEVELTYMVVQEALVITTLEDAEAPDHMRLAAHPVHDLIEWSRDRQSADYDSLIDLITTTIAPESWVDVGGPGSIQELDGWLLLSQTHDVHAQIESLLASLRQALSYKSHPLALGISRESMQEKRLQEALDRDVEASFVEEPLQRAVAKLGERVGVPLVLKMWALKMAGVSIDTPITADLPRGPLGNQLRLLLDPLGLTCVIRDGALLVTTREDAESPDNQAARVYDVRPLVDPDLGITSMDRLIDAVTTLLTPEDWVDVGGPASIKEFRNLLVISHMEAGHREVEQLLGALEEHCLRLGPRAEEDQLVIPINRTAGDAEIEALLRRSVDVDLHNAPLGMAVKQLADQCALPLVLDDRRLKEAGVNPETRVTLAARGITLESALRLILDEHELAFQVRQGVLVVTTQERDAANLPLVAYRVDCLLGKGADALLDMLTAVVAPESWVDVGGPGAVEILGDWLLVSHTREVQQKIERLIGRLSDQTNGEGRGVVTDRTPGEERMQAALQREVPMQFHETPLADAIAKLAENSDVPIVVSVKRLEEAGVNIDVPVSIDVPAAPLGNQLRLLLELLGLGFSVRHEVLLVTSSEDLDSTSRTTIRDYDIQSLDDLAHASPEQQSLVDLVTNLIEPESWVDVGGPGVARMFQGRLLVQHRDDVHARVGRLLAALDQHCGPASAARTDQPPVVNIDADPRAQAIERALARTVDAEIRSRPIAEVLKSLAAAHGVTLVLDERALEEAGLDPLREVASVPSGLMLGSALDRLLTPCDLTYTIGDRVLQVTGKEYAAKHGEVRLYHVADVLARKNRSLDVLVSLVIQATGEQDAAQGDGPWSDQGGLGELVPIEPGWLAVAADLHLQHRVEDLLTEWRTGSVPRRERERRALAAVAKWKASQPERNQAPPSQAAEDPFGPPAEPRSEH